MRLIFRLAVSVDDDYPWLWLEVRICIHICWTLPNECIWMNTQLILWLLFHCCFTDNMSEYIKNATDLIEQGHVRVGTEVVKDPAFLVSRTLEDFVTWVDSSKIRRHVMEYNNMVRCWWFFYSFKSLLILAFL